MRKSGRRFVAILLSVMMIASQMGITAFAIDDVKADGSAKAASEQTAEQKSEAKSEASDNSSEKTEKDSVATDEKAAEETAAQPEDNSKAAEPGSGDAVTDEPQATNAEQPAAAEKQEGTAKEVSFSQTATVDGVKIKVSADKGVFPEGAKLVAKNAGSSAAKAADKAIGDEEQAESSYAFDISVTDEDGNKIQPDNSKGETKVSFTTEEVADRSLETSVYHIEGKTAEELNAKESGSTATVRTKSFSVFVLKFYTGDDNDVAATYTIETGKKVYLNNLIEKVGLGSYAGVVDYSKTDRHGDKRLTINTDSSDPSDSTGWYVIADGVWKNDESAALTFYNGSKQELFSINIKCAEVAVTAPEPIENLVYSGTEQKLVSPGSVKGGSMKYHCTEVDADAPTSGWSNDVPSQKNAGSYWVWYTAVDDAGNDIAEPAHVTATIAKKACEITLDPVGLTLNYTGVSQKLVTAGDAGDGNMYYSLNGGDFRKAAIPERTEPGEYTIQYKASKNDPNYKDSEIKTIKAYIKDPGAVSITLPEAKDGLEFSGDPQELITSGSVDSGFEIYYSVKTEAGWTNYDTALPVGTDAGKYPVRYKVFTSGGATVDYSQYKFVDATSGTTEVAPYGTLSIKIDRQPVKITLPAAKTDLVYTGEKQELVNDGEAPAAFDFYYAVTGASQTNVPVDADYTSAIPAYRDIGTYKVWYKIGRYGGVSPTVDLNNFTFVDSDGNTVEAEGAVPVSIAKDTPYIYEFPEAKEGLVYNGGDQELVTAGSVRKVDGHDYVWKYSFEAYDNFIKSIPKKKEAGEYTVYCRVMDGTEFVGTEPELALKVKIAEPTITPPVGAELTYNGKAQNLIGYEATTNSGQIFYSVGSGWKTDPAEITGENAGTYTVSWKVEGAETLKSGTVTATIAKGQAVSTKDPEVIEGLIYNGQDQFLLTKGTATNGVWQYRITSINGEPVTSDFANALPVGKVAGTYTIECKVEPISSNYEGSEVIEKMAVIADPTITAPVAAELVYNGQNQILIGYEGKTNSGTFYYSLNGETWETSPAKIMGMTVGSYPIQWQAKLGNEYLDAGTITATIAAGQALAVKEPKKVTGLVYNDQPQTLLSDGTAAFGQWVYRIISINGEAQEESTFAPTLPTGTEAGIYTIECKVKGDTGYKDTDPIIKNVAIDELEVTAPVGVGLIYNGKPQELLETAATTNSTDRNVKVYYRIKKDPLPEASADIPKEIGDAEKTTDYTIQYWAARSSNPTHEISKIGEVTSVISWINFKPPVTLNAVYNGDDQELVVTPASIKDGAEGVIQYCLTNSKEDDDWTTDYASLQGKDAAEYNVYYRIVDPATINQEVIYGPAVVTAKITEANPLKTAPEAVAVDYNGEPQALATEGALTKLAKNDGLKIEYTCSSDGVVWSDWSEDVPEATNAGSYYVQYRVNEDGADENFARVSRITLISKIGKIDPEVTEPVANKLTYSGAPQALLTAGTSESANWKYWVRSYPQGEEPRPADSYSETVPTATAAGDYIVRCYVPETDNYNATEYIEIEVTIARPTIEAPVGADRVYNTREQALLERPATTNSTDPNVKVVYRIDGTNDEITTIPQAVGNANENTTYTILYAVKNMDTGDYLTAAGSVKASIRTIRVSTPEALNGTYNGRAQRLITDYDDPEAGRFQFSLDQNDWSRNIPTKTDVGEYNVYWRVVNRSDDLLYGPYYVTAKIAKAAAVSLKNPAAVEGLVYDGKAHELIVPGETRTGEWRYKLVGGPGVDNVGDNDGGFSTEIPTGTKPGQYVVKAFIKGDDNHENSEKITLNVFIDKAEPSADIEAVRDLVYDGNPHELVTIESRTPEDAPIQFSFDAKKFQDEIPAETEPGTYDIYYRILETDNYKASEVLGPIVVTIDRIEVRVNRPDAIDSVYNGAEQVLVEPGRARATNSDGVYTLLYKMSYQPDTDYREYDAAVFSATKVGEYTVDYKVVEMKDMEPQDIDRSHVRLVDRAGRRVDNPDSVTATISELTLSDAEGITIDYDGDKHALISTPAVTNSTDEDVVVVYYLLEGTDEYAKVEDATPIGEPNPSTSIPEQAGQAGKTSHYIIKYWAANSSNIGVPISEQKVVRSTIKWLNLEAPEPVTTAYNGQAQKLLVKPGSAVRGTVKYCLGTPEYEEDKWTDNIDDITATDPDTYTIYYRVYENGQILQGRNDGISEEEKYVEAVITKGQVNVFLEPRGISGIVYDGEDHVLLRAGVVRHGTWMYGFVPADGNLQNVNYSDELPVGNKAGTYTIACYVKGDEHYANYLDSDPLIIKVRIAKAEPSAVVEAIDGLSYTGESQPLVKILSRTPEDAGVWFSEDGYNFSADIPEGTDAGKYKIYYKVVGEGNYGESAVFELDAKISKIKLSVAVKPKAAGNPLPYTDAKQALVTEGESAPADISKMVYSLDGEEFTEEIPEVKDAGRYTVYYKAVASDSEVAKNYVESETGTVDVRIKKADFVMTAPTGKSLTYNGEAQELVNEGSVPEGYRLQYVYNTYDADSSPLGKDAGKYKVKYYVAAGDAAVNMNLFNVIDEDGNPVDPTGTVITTIDKAQPTVEVKGVNSVYDGTFKSLVDVTKIPEDTVLKYKIKKDGELLGEFSDPRMKDAGVYEVEWKIVGDENHEGDSFYHDSVTAVVSKTVLRVKAPQAIPGLVYNGSSQQLMSAGSLVGDVADQASLKYAVTLASEDEPTASQFYYSGKEMTNAGKYYIWYDVFTADGKAKLDKKNIDVVDFYTGASLTDSLPGRVEGKISKQGIDVVWGETTHVYDAHPWAPVGVATPSQDGAENLELTETGFETDTNAKTGRDYTATVALANKADRQNYFLTEDTASTSFKIEQRKVRLSWKPNEFSFDRKAHLPFAVAWDTDVCAEDKDREILGESYSVEGENVTDGKAILPGNYKVYVNELRDKNYVPNDKSSTYEGQFVIKKGTYDGPEGTLAVYLEGWIYKDDPNEPQVTGLPELGMKVTYFYKKSKEGEDAWKAYDTSHGQYPTEVGTYDIKAVVAETSTYEEATATNVFAISPAAAGLVAPTAIDREYDGTTQDLVTAGSIERGQMRYLVSDTKPTPDAEFKDEIPTAKDAGTYKVWYKYDVTDPDYEEVHGIGGPVTVTVSKKPVSITWDKLRLTYNSKEQKPTAEVLRADGLVSGDTVKVDVSTGDVETIDVGRYRAYATLTGESADNYEIIVGDETKRFEITPADLTVVWGEKQFVYDGKPHVPEVESLEGVFDGDIVSAYSTGEKVEVGTYTATAHIKGQDADNYTISKPRTEFTISAEEIASIKWENLEFTYDGEGHKPTAKLIGTDDKEIAGITAVVAGTKVDAGTYEAKVIGIEGDGADNYKLPADVTTEFTINKRVVELVWTKTETTYNGDIQKPEVSVGNKVSGDDVRVNIDTAGYTNAGEYEYDDASKLSLSGRDKANYELPKSIDQTFVIKKADAVLDWTNLEFVYDGKEHKPTATITNLIGDDQCQVVVKPGAVEAGTHWTAAYIEGNDNYQLSKEMSAKQFLINPREAVIKWSDLNPVYNGTDQVPTATIANAAGGEKIDVKVIAVDADGNPLGEGEYTEAGDYIAKALLPDGGDYVLPEDCTTSYSIAKAELMVTAKDKTISYGQSPVGNGVTYSGFLPGDTSAVVKGDVTYSFNYKKNGKPGSYSITPAGLKAENYKMKYVNGTLVVQDVNRFLISKGIAKGSKKIKVQWTSVDGAASYEVYMSKCNKKTKKYTPKKIKTLTGDYTSYIKGKLKKKQCYKFYVVAKDANGKVIARSTTGHCLTGNSNKENTNAKSISLNTSTVNITKGSTAVVSVKQKKVKKGKKLLNNTHAPLVRYLSTNTQVATVNGSGVIHGVGSGYCKVYVQAVNGIWKHVDVYVK